MSIESLKALRQSGVTPTSVWIIVGDKPARTINIDDFGVERGDMILISPRDDIRSLDLRVLVGLHVDVFENGDHPALFDKVALKIDAAKPASTGLANRFGVDGVSDKHNAVLRRAMKMICN